MFKETLKKEIIFLNEPIIDPTKKQEWVDKIKKELLKLGVFYVKNKSIN